MPLSWAAVCSFCRVLCSTFIAAVVAQFRLPISEQVAKTIVVFLFTVVICVLFIAVACVAVSVAVYG